MKDKVEIPERFDLAFIRYTNGCKGLGYAPISRIDVGDTVKTAWDEGVVESMVNWCTPEDDYYKLIAGVMTVDRITHKIVEVTE